MCGIVGFVGDWSYSDALDSLRKLFYRGYDSCGIVYDGKLVKAIGDNLPNIDTAARVMLGHTRWATHGRVCLENTHPVESDFAFLVHNGIVENADPSYDTDTYFALDQVIRGPSYMSELMQGMSVFVWIEKSKSDRLYFLRKGLSQLYIGKTQKGYMLCSDADLIPCEVVWSIQADQFGYVDERGIVLLSDNKGLLEVKKGRRSDIRSSYDDLTVSCLVQGLDMATDSARQQDCTALTSDTIGSAKCAAIKNVYSKCCGKSNNKAASQVNIADKELDSKSEHGVLDGIGGGIRADSRSKASLQRDAKGRLDAQISTRLEMTSEEQYKTKLEIEIEQQSSLIPAAYDKGEIIQANQYTFIGSGSAYYASKIAAHWAVSRNIPAQAMISSEIGIHQGLCVFISQSGQTIETIEAAYTISSSNNRNDQCDYNYADSNLAKESCKTVGIINRANSALEQYVDRVLYTNAGVEESVASTKAFTCQLAVLAKMLDMSMPNLPLNDVQLPDSVLDMCDGAQNLYLLSKGIGVTVCEEIALKVKELAYIHAFGMSSSEFKHGPLALVDENFLCIVLNPSFGSYARVNSNAQEILARGGRVIMLTDKPFADDRILFVLMPETDLVSMPFVYVKFGQLLALKLAQRRGLNIDQPRNLVKSVTVL